MRLPPAPSAAALAALVLLAACGGPDGSVQPSGSVLPEACAPDLPARTSPEDFPFAVLWIDGEDLPPIPGAITYRGSEGAVEHEAPDRLHALRFIVVQSRGTSHASIRMTDDVTVAAWTVYAVPASTFRGGDLESDRVVWSEGSRPTDLICLPLVEGQWLVGAEITFADDQGTGDFFWRLDVTERGSASG